MRDDGVVFISIDDNEQANLKKICDDVFGEENFVDTIIWEKRYSPQNAVQWFSEGHDFILVYAKRKEEWRPNLLERTEDMNARYRNLDKDPRGDWKPTDATAQGGHGTTSQFYTLKAPNGKEHTLSPGRCWVYTEKVMNEMIADNRVWFGTDGNNVPAIKRFLTEVKQGTACKTIWNYEDVGHNQEGKKEIISLFNAAPFETPKPVRLIRRILQLSTNSKDDDLVLDFFSGSSTTAHAAMQLNAEDGGNRRFIMVQIPEKTDEGSEAYKAGFKTIADIGKERIRRAGEKIQAEHPLIKLDTGFRVFKLDTSNLKKWDDDFANMTREQQAETLFSRMENSLEELKPERREIDVVYEIFVKYGVPLTEPLSELTVDGKKFYAVGEDGYLFICLDKDITVEVLENMIKKHTPGTIIFADRCFAEDDDITNATLALQKAEIEFRWI